jgi:hypothetical protein
MTGWDGRPHPQILDPALHPCLRCNRSIETRCDLILRRTFLHHVAHPRYGVVLVTTKTYLLRMQFLSNGLTDVEFDGPPTCTDYSFLTRFFAVGGRRLGEVVFDVVQSIFQFTAMIRQHDHFHLTTRRTHRHRSLNSFKRQGPGNTNGWRAFDVYCTMT